VEVLARWSELMKRPEDGIPLDEAAMLISAQANPSLRLAEQLRRLDEIAGQVDRADVASVSRVLFERLGLRGDRDAYDDPLNSYIDRVLDRRLGIPISLSVLMIEIGRRCGVRLEAVGMPGHFLVRDPSAADQLIDPFDQGRRLNREECERLLHATTGQVSELTPEMLATTGPRAILTRMLVNLDRSFERRGDRAALAWVSEMRMAIPQVSLADRRQLAARLAYLGRFDTAAAVLEGAATDVADSPVRQRLLHEASTIRARLN
jgi:regulator of sirC expression with transglutaminase-like and TPR domain